MQFTSILAISSGIFWSLVYLLIIKRGFQDKTYGMPMVALCANISWEFIFSFVYPGHGAQRLINMIWFSLDLVILGQFLWFGRKESPENRLLPWFSPAFLLTLALSFLMIMGITLEFKDWSGVYAAFGQNLMMSVLFISLLAKRNNINGQSVYIAVFKMLGTLAPSIILYISNPSLLSIVLAVSILGFDCLYILKLCRKYQELKLNPWTREIMMNIGEIPATNS